MANNYRFELIVCDFMQNGKKKVVEEFPPLLCCNAYILRMVYSSCKGTANHAFLPLGCRPWM